jgi:GTP pyrophosphokinase
LDPGDFFKSDKSIEIAKRFNYAQMDDFLMSLGNGDLNINTVMTRIKEDIYKEALQNIKQASLESLILENAHKDIPYGKASKGIRVRGIDNVLIRLSHCCKPLPGDPIIGYITRGRGVSIHRVDCPNACYHTQEEGSRIIDVAWEDHLEGAYEVELEIFSKDRARLASDIMVAVADMKVPIHAINCRALRNGTAITNLKIEIKGLSHLNYVIERILRIRDVTEARRLVRRKHEEKP